MKKYINLVLAIIVAAAISGCAHVRTADKYNDIKVTDFGGESTTMVSANYGFYLLAIVPIVSGDPANPGNILWFTRVKVAPCYEALVKEAKSQGATQLMNVSSETDYNGLPWMLAFIGIYEAQVSGNAIK